MVDPGTRNYLLKHPGLLVGGSLGQAALTKRLIHSELRDMKKLWSSKKDLEEKLLYSAGDERYHKTGWLYGLCRRFRPRVLVETGVRAGASSSFILAALTDNSEGNLTSIDLPNSKYEYVQDNVSKVQDDALPRGEDSGFAIPQELKKRWRLIPGDAKMELPKLLESIYEIDFFFHDSEHTYEHMMFEFDAVYKKLKPGGILASDDTNWNTAFPEFCERERITPFVYNNASFAFKGIRGKSLEQIWRSAEL
jgi:predicted O-methyltransferase YrrM